MRPVDVAPRSALLTPLAPLVLLPQAALLAGLAVTVGVRPLGLAAGAAAALLTWHLLARGLDGGSGSGGRRALGPADLVTLARAVLTGGVVALVADAVPAGSPAPCAAGLALVALPLDAVDGRVARGTGTASPFGARFDMEVDAALILALSALLATRLGPWVLAAGLLRYAFAAAGRVVPWLRGELPARRSRKVVAAAQGVVLAVAATGLLPRTVAAAAVALALAALVWSFGRDVGLLHLDYRAAAPKAPRNRSLNALIGHTGASGAGRRPVLHPHPEMRSSTAGS